MRRRALRGDAQMRDVRLVALTGYGAEEDRRRSQEAGFDFHLTKPVLPDQLLALLQRAAPGSGRVAS